MQATETDSGWKIKKEFQKGYWEAHRMVGMAGIPGLGLNF